MNKWRRRGLKTNDAVQCLVIGGKGNYGRIGAISCFASDGSAPPYDYDRAYVVFPDDNNEWLSVSNIKKVSPLVALAAAAIR